jgi:hypothetical protein
MTRITGSVPDGRTTSRPWPLSRFGAGDRRLHLGIFERLAAAVAHVLEHLRQRLEAVADFRHRLVLFHHRQHLQRGDKAVAGRGVVGQDDVAGRLAADIVAVLAHVLEHVAVADRRAHQRKLQLLQMPLEAEIGHHGGDDAGLGEPAIFAPAFAITASS